MNKDLVEKYIDDNLDSYLEILKGMVDINSYTLNPAGINRLNDFTISIYNKLGFTGTKVPSDYKLYGDHLILEKKGSVDKTIAFISHLDTVYSADEEQKNGFVWSRVGDRIYGPGTVDIKGGTIMIYIILDLLRNFNQDLYDQMSFTILLDCAEEVGGADFGELCKKQLPIDRTLCCLVFEGCNINNQQHYKVVSRKGMATFNIEVTGRSSHSGTAHGKGANAIVQASRLVEELSRMTDPSKNLTVNVGRIEGGTVRNRVADFCSIQLEMRAADLNVFHKTVEEIEKLKFKSSVSSPFDGWKCGIEIHKEIVTPPWEKNPKSDFLFEIWAQASTALGIPMKDEFRGGLSDGNLLWQDYAVIDGLGPGGANSHCSEKDEINGKEQEYLTISSYTPVALINTYSLLELIKRSLSGSDQGN